MNSNFTIIETGIHIQKNCNNDRISRHIFRYNNTSICLVRAYCYPHINIIIISQIKGEVINSKYPIRSIMQKLQLKPKKTIWITHIKNKFYKRSVRFNPLALMLKKNHHWQLDDKEKETSLHTVEELIIEKLEPVEIWFSLDAELYYESELRRQGELKDILQLYLKPDLEFLTSKFEQIEYDIEQIDYKNSQAQAPDFPIRGALFYYPEIKLENKQKHTCFVQQQFLKISHTNRLALPYVNKYDVEKEVVICVQINEDETVCGIFPKINFLRSKKTESNC